MPILTNSSGGRSVTEGWRTLELFTDRHSYIRLFLSYLNERPQSERILYLFGEGGNGKSLLLKFIFENYCKVLHPEDWEWIRQRAKNDRQLLRLVREAKGAELAIPIMLDFGVTAQGEDRPHEAFSGLLMLQRALARHNLHFPLFNFACLCHLDRTGRLTDERLKNLFPPEEMDLVTELAETLLASKWLAPANIILKLFGKHLRKDTTLYVSKRGLATEVVDEIQRMEPRTELVNELPRLFAEDLNAAVALAGGQKRVTLFFDAHETFWGDRRNLSRTAFFERDEWLRSLLGWIDLTAGIRVVVAGREAPLWHKARQSPISSHNIESKRVRDLPRSYSDYYLRRAGVAADGVRRQILSYTQVVRGRCHPLFLGLCTDVVRAAAARGVTLTPEEFRASPETAKKGEELVEKLLSHADSDVAYSVRVLSACRVFNAEIYYELGRSLNFYATAPAFEELTQFSFVWHAQRRGEGWYRLHELLRRVFYDRSDPVTMRAHAELERYYRTASGSGDSTAIAEAVYHANRIDWRRGAREWVKTFDEARDGSRFGLCSVLLEIRGHLIVKDSFERGCIAASSAPYFAEMARYPEAIADYKLAVSEFKAHTRENPDDADAYDAEGLSLARLGDAYVDLSRTSEAAGSYRSAIAALNKALSINPGHHDAHNNKGWALLSLGELQHMLSHNKKAKESLLEAISSFEQSLEHAPGYRDALLNKGYAYGSLGEVMATLSQYDEAVENYLLANSIYEEALTNSPDNLTALLNQGATYQSLGETQQELSRYEEAARAYNKSVQIL